MFFNQTSRENLTGIINFPWTNHIWRKICFACICLMEKNEKTRRVWTLFLVPAKISSMRYCVCHTSLQWKATARSFRIVAFAHKFLWQRDVNALTSQEFSYWLSFLDQSHFIISTISQNLCPLGRTISSTSFRFKIRRLTELTRENL